MLWRVRATLPDKPGTLAMLAQRCGEAGVNILGLQIFPGLDDVTDEMVLSTDDAWTAEQVTALVADAGGTDVVTQASTEAALDDQPTRYVTAARAILERPMSFPEVVARLFDAEAEPTDPDVVHDTMEMEVGDVQVQVHRTAPFTETERARGTAMAALVNDVLSRTQAAPPATTGGGRRLGTGATPEYVVEPDAVSAYVDGVVVGTATVGEAVTHDDGATLRPVDLAVDPAWQRRGIGTRLLLDAARIAQSLDADEILLTTGSDNQAVLPMVLGAGLRGRIRMAADELTVRVPVGGLRPLAR
ncbi:GNAT family N-acetyltransferase [Nocardioides panacihumi]